MKRTKNTIPLTFKFTYSPNALTEALNSHGDLENLLKQKLEQSLMENNTTLDEKGEQSIVLNITIKK